MDLSGTTILLIVVLVVLFLVVFINVVSFFLDFARELRYINMEIQRNTGKDQLLWMRRRRNLWLSLIPFIRLREDDKE